VVKNVNKEPIEGVAIKVKNIGTSTNKKGEFNLNIPKSKKITITFSHVAYETFKKTITAPSNNTYQIYLVLNAKIEQIKEITVIDKKKEAQGLISVNPSDITKIPGANQGVENILMTLAGVNNNNELSTQYNVRGGNFDENLVYVNGNFF
jgi:hypothetical protein